MELLARPDVQVVAVCDCNRYSKDYVEYGENDLLKSARRLLGAGYENWGEDLASPGVAQLTHEFRTSLGMGGREPAKRLVEAYYGSRKGYGSGTYKGCAAYSDYRELLEKEKDLDAVYVATPDHWHAPISLAAMKRHKHVLCQKPMTHTIGDARRMAQMAREMKVATSLPVNNPSSEPTQADLGMDRRWRHRAGARSAQLVEPSVLAAGHRPARRKRSRFPRAWIGICGWVPRRSVRSTTPICRSSGAAGTISAAARSAIWAATASPACSRSWGSRRRVGVEACSSESFDETLSESLHRAPGLSGGRRAGPRCACRGTTAVCARRGRPALRAEDRHYFEAGEDNEGILYVGDKGIILAGFNGNNPRVYPESKKYQPPARPPRGERPRDAGASISGWRPARAARPRRWRTSRSRVR